MTLIRKVLALKTSISRKCLKWLKDYNKHDLFNSGTRSPCPSSDIIKELEPFRMKSPTVLYRGISFYFGQETIKTPKLGRKFQYTEAACSSWTKKVHTALKFAKRLEVGFVLKCTINPEETIIDVSDLDDNIKLKWSGESEVIVAEGTYNTTVVFIYDLANRTSKSSKKLYE